MGMKPRMIRARAATPIGKTLRTEGRTLEELLLCGGECDDADGLVMLLEVSLRTLAAARDKRAACDLLATPARMRLPARIDRLRIDGDGDER